MTIVIMIKLWAPQHLEQFFDVNRTAYYLYASRKDLMLEIGYFSSLYTHFRLLIVALKRIWAENYAAETFYVSNYKSKNNYVVGLFR